jgi:hypothetical protein
MSRKKEKARKELEREKERKTMPVPRLCTKLG